MTWAHSYHQSDYGGASLAFGVDLSIIIYIEIHQQRQVEASYSSYLKVYKKGSRLEVRGYLWTSLTSATHQKLICESRATHQTKWDKDFSPETDCLDKGYFPKTE